LPVPTTIEAVLFQTVEGILDLLGVPDANEFEREDMEELIKKAIAYNERIKAAENYAGV
jgi:hypothetical protein